MNFLRRAHDEYGIRNIEMECTSWIATCNRAKIKCEYFVQYRTVSIHIGRTTHNRRV